jgi:hypothetical protein
MSPKTFARMVETDASQNFHAVCPDCHRPDQECECQPKRIPARQEEGVQDFTRLHDFSPTTQQSIKRVVADMVRTSSGPLTDNAIMAIARRFCCNVDDIRQLSNSAISPSPDSDHRVSSPVSIDPQSVTHFNAL